MFSIYLELGIDHILDINGYDHMLFLLALCVPFSVKDWKKVLVLITAFTIGHSLTLVLAAMDIVNFSPYWIEIFIPLTILIAALQNLIRISDKSQNRLSLYPLALSFGFIHGLGFSNYFTSLLGREAAIIVPLLGFNIGVELAQLIFVCIIMMIGYLVTRVGKLKRQYWIMAISILAAISSAYMIFQRF